MKVLAVVSQKGGVGKTTLALNVAYALANRGLRTILMDTDPQGAVGLSLDNISASEGTVGCILRSAPPRAALLTTRLPELSILPFGNATPGEAAKFHSQVEDGGALTQLVASVADKADVVIIDTPSGLSGSTLGALRTADSAISPLQAEPLAMRSLPQLLGTIAELRESGHRIELVGLVLSMLQQRQESSLSVAEEAWKRLPGDLVLETTLPRDPSVLDASALGLPLGLVSRLRPPPIALVFEQLALELIPRLELAPNGAEEAPVGLFA